MAWLRSSLARIGLMAASSSGYVVGELDKPEKFKFHSPIDQYPNLTIGHCNHMAQCLNSKMYARLSQKVTKLGFSLDDVIQPGVDNPSKPSNVQTGLVAGDEECYEIFRELFECVVKEKFGYQFDAHSSHPSDCDFSQLKIDKMVSEKIVNIRFRICRNLSKHPFPSLITRAGRRLIESVLLDVFEKCVKDKSFGRDREVTYYSLVDLPDQFKQTFSSSWQSTGVNRDWPDSRGAFILLSNAWSPTVVSINDRDHIRMWTEIKGDISDEYIIKSIQIFFNDVQSVEDALLGNYGSGFSWDDKFGYLTSNPSDIGTTLKIEAEIRCAELYKNPRLLSIINSKCGPRLKLLDASEENKSVKLTNTERIGQSEVELIQLFFDDLKSLVQIDENLDSHKNAKE